MHEFIYLHEYSITRLPTQSKDCFIQQFTFHNNLQLYLSIHLYIHLSLSPVICLSQYFLLLFSSFTPVISTFLFLFSYSVLPLKKWTEASNTKSILSVWIEQESESLSNLIICVKCATHVYVVTPSSHLTCPHAFSPALLFIIYSVSLLEMAL